MTKILLIGVAAIGVLLAQPQNANAGVDVNVTVSTYPAHYPVRYYPDYGYPSYHHDYDDDDNRYDRISCWKGRRIVRWAGYRGVETVKCYGGVYRYRGWKRGHQWRVSVDADTGRIIRARPVHHY